MTTAQAFIHEAQATLRASRTRWSVLTILFLITVINYADRATISMAGPAIAKELGLNAVTMGYVFSAFSWSYVAAQIPGGWLLDRFGSKKVYACAIFTWSLFTMFTGTVGLFTGMAAVAMMFAFRFVVGAAEAPSFPANSRIVAAWFPAQERATASAIFNSAQYAATVVFAPLMGWIIHTYGWHHVFTFMGVVGILFVAVWNRYVHNPKDHPGINKAELDHITEGGALVNMDQQAQGLSAQDTGRYIKQLLRNRMTVGIYVAQYCISTLTFFFLTWFPVYLVQARGMTILKAGLIASIPAVCGFIGGLLGGFFSDWLLKKTGSLTLARKVPIVIGMLLSMSMVVCNYTESHTLVVTFMALAFFGKGVGALGWAVNSDTAPRAIAGLSGGLFNTFGNLSGITTPIAIGYIVNDTGSFNGALVYVGVHAAIAIFCYLVVVKEIKRVELK